MGWKLIRRLNTLAYLEKEKAVKEEAEKTAFILPEEESYITEEESPVVQDEILSEETELTSTEDVKVEQSQEAETVEVVKEKKTTKKSTKKKKA